MRRILSIPALWLLLMSGPAALPAATLEQLSLEQMVDKSTAIVRGRVSGTSTLLRNSVIYTCYQIQVAQRWKGTANPQEQVCTAGGTAQGIRQTFPGAPQLASGDEYVLFLWAGKSGMNQLIGLSQGVFDLKVDSAGQSIASRPAITEPMLNSAGQQVSDNGVIMRLRDLSARIERQLAAGRRQ